MKNLKNRTTRFLFFLFGDAILLALAAGLAYWVLNVVIPESALPFPLTDFLIFALVSVAALAASGMYNINWRFVSLHELVRIGKALTLGGAAALAGGLLIHGATNFFPAFLFITWTLSLLLVSGLRVSKRILLEVIRRPKRTAGVVVFGAGNAGEQIVRDIQRNNDWELNIEAIFDDKRELWGTSIHDIQVLGGRRDLYNYLANREVQELIVAAPSLPKKDLKEILEEVRAERPPQSIKVLPSFHRLTDQSVSIKHLRDIRIEDILGRETAEIDYSKIRSDITGKRVMITGAGGTIGSEMVRQLLKFSPESIIALDIDETELYDLENELAGIEGAECVYTCVADITDAAKMDRVFGERRPQIVYHAAAYKHVPMMERYPEEAIRVNVGGTRLLSELSCRHGVEKFIFISSDKAVNPANVMGATKRVSEHVCMSYNDLCTTNFVSVRFGNVLGSRGSVVPLFIDQIKAGGPLTVTHPDVKRYFMTIPEAVLLVVQAGVMGDGGEVFVLDMGEPVRIVDMAHQLIRLHGLEPDKDIAVVFKGLRPGEKLFEELLNAGEGHTPTPHPLVHKAACNRTFENGRLDYLLDALLEKARAQEPDEVRGLLKKLVPTYKFNGELRREQQAQELAAAGDS